MTIRESFKRFQYFNFETNFLENENLFQKTGVPFLVETTNTEDTSLPFKTTLSESNVKTNRMATTKWTYHKSGVLPVTYFSGKFVSGFGTSLIELIWCTKDPNVYIRVFRKRWSLILGCFFPVSILKVLWYLQFLKNTRYLGIILDLF